MMAQKPEPEAIPIVILPLVMSSSVRHELKRNTIHAITQAGRLRAVVENMPKMPPQRRQWTSVRTRNKKLRSSEVSTAASIGAQKLGQPVLLSNLVVEENSGNPHPPHR